MRLSAAYRAQISSQNDTPLDAPQAPKPGIAWANPALGHPHLVMKRGVLSEFSRGVLLRALDRLAAQGGAVPMSQIPPMELDALRCLQQARHNAHLAIFQTAKPPYVLYSAGVGLERRVAGPGTPALGNAPPPHIAFYAEIHLSAPHEGGALFVPSRGFALAPETGLLAAYAPSAAHPFGIGDVQAGTRDVVIASFTFDPRREDPLAASVL
jgi:hypothetical protein